MTNLPLRLLLLTAVAGCGPSTGDPGETDTDGQPDLADAVPLEACDSVILLATAGDLDLEISAPVDAYGAVIDDRVATATGTPGVDGFDVIAEVGGFDQHAPCTTPEESLPTGGGAWWRGTSGTITITYTPDGPQPEDPDDWAADGTPLGEAAIVIDDLVMEPRSGEGDTLTAARLELVARHARIDLPAR